MQCAATQSRNIEEMDKSTHRERSASTEGQAQLQQNGAIIYLDLRALRPGDKYVALTKSGTFRPQLGISHTVTLKPQFMHTCMVKVGIRDKLANLNK